MVLSEGVILPTPTVPSRLSPQATQWIRPAAIVVGGAFFGSPYDRGPFRGHVWLRTSSGGRARSAASGFGTLRRAGEDRPRYGRLQWRAPFLNVAEHGGRQGGGPAVCEHWRGPGQWVVARGA